MFRRIVGFTLLTAFLGYMGYKFIDSMGSNVGDSFLTALLGISVVLIILLGIRRVLQN